MILTDEEIEIFELAYLLHLPVYKIMTEMPYEELLGWLDYFRRRPAGWREDRRTALSMRAAGAEFSEEALFPTLGMIMKNRKSIVNKGSVMYNYLLSASGGDKLEE